MSDKIIQLNEGIIKEELGEMVRQSVEDTLNAMLEEEADQLTKVLSRIRPVDKVNFAKRKKRKVGNIFVSIEYLRENKWP